MPQIPYYKIDFKHANSWGIRDGPGELSLSPAAITHAAVTVGHRGMRGRRQMIFEGDFAAEIEWKRSSLRAAVQVEDVLQQPGIRSVSRLTPRGHLRTSDPSEKGGLSYHFGMSMAAAWVRNVLRIPWLLHLDVYWEALGIPKPGESRPDLVGRHPDGRWVAVEAKGLAGKPTRKQQTRGRDQAKRVVDIGGSPPDLNLAIFSFFGTDRLACSNPKPKVASLWVVDPPPSADDDDPAEDRTPIRLPELDESTLLKFYYEPWLELFEAPGFDDAGDGADGPFTWRRLGGQGPRIGILPAVLRDIQVGDFTRIPGAVAEAEQFGWAKDQPYWAGDGIVIEPGRPWLIGGD